jgi:zinc and cadmium transporter
MLFWIAGASLSIALIAFVGMVILFLKKELLSKILLILVAFSAGTLLGSAFLHLLPEAIEKFVGAELFLWLLGGFVLFFFIEKILQWHHCHELDHIHTLGLVSLIADSIHNFTDGLIIAAAFLTNLPLGLITTLTIAVHEIPQEIGDLGILLYSGFDKVKALLLNFLAASVVLFGGLTGYFIFGYVERFTAFLLPLAAGSFIYIASSDLIPEIRKELGLKRGLFSFAVFLLGILFMHILRMV